MAAWLRSARLPAIAGRQSNYVYGAAKAGLATLVQGIAHRLALRTAGRARAVVVKPGFVDTPMTAGMKKGGPLWAQPDDVAPNRAQSGRQGRPDRLCAVVLALHHADHPAGPGAALS